MKSNMPTTASAASSLFQLGLRYSRGPKAAIYITQSEWLTRFAASVNCSRDEVVTGRRSQRDGSW